MVRPRRKRIPDRGGEREGRYKLLTDLAPIGILLMGPGGRCTYANARWQELTGQALEESLGFGWTRAFHPEERGAVRQWWAHHARGRCEFAGKHRVLAPDGSIRWVQMRARPMFSNEGEVRGFLAAVEESGP